jgi:hypothetical protein
MDVLSTAVALRKSGANQQQFQSMKRRLNQLRFGPDEGAT